MVSGKPRIIPEWTRRDKAGRAGGPDGSLPSNKLTKDPSERRAFRNAAQGLLGLSLGTRFAVVLSLSQRQQRIDQLLGLHWLEEDLVDA
jgi:hypothetical protein